MQKRKILLGTYDTAANGWTLAAWHLTDAVQKTNRTDKPGGDGSWDLSTALTDGVQKFNDRTLTITLECSEGDRLSRKAKIDQLINQWEGMNVAIVLPDDVGLYINGSLHIEEKYNDLAHAAVEITAICEPWKYATEETVVSLALTSEDQTAILRNDGRRVVVPVLKIAGTNASAQLTLNRVTTTLSAGTYKVPEFMITPGAHVLTYSGTGTLEIRYREAVLR